MFNTSDKEFKTRIVKREIYPENFVWWDEISRADVDKFKNTLDKAKDEKVIQKFFEDNPIFLIQHLCGGHGRWCIPHIRLGAQYIPDFMIGEKHSFGYEWYAVELESPRSKLYISNGEPSKHLRHAEKQITDWRGWLESNIDYAKRPIEDNGLGLKDINCNIKAYIIIGRRDNIGDEPPKWRMQRKNSMGIEIHTYDWLIENAEMRLRSLERKLSQDIQ